MPYDVRKHLREAISRSGLVIKEIAAKSGVKKGTIDNWVGTSPTIPKVTDAYSVADALKITVEELVTGKRKAHDGLPPRVADIVEDLLRLDDHGLNSVATLAHGLAEQAATPTPRTPAPRDPSLRGIKPPGIVPVRALDDNEKQA